MCVAQLVAAFVLVLLGPAVAFAELVYAFEWKSYSRVSRHVDDEGSDEGEITDTAQLTMRRNARGEWLFSFNGPHGSGTGRLTRRGPEALSFPTALTVGRPPAPAHLRGGWFTFTGAMNCPATFQLEFA